MFNFNLKQVDNNLSELCSSYKLVKYEWKLNSIGCSSQGLQSLGQSYGLMWAMAIQFYS